jgi:4-alpha-glucanotransferase
MADTGRGCFSSGRHAGVLVPLFSIPSRRSWGIGEIPDLVPLARWLRTAGLDFVQLLPVNEMQEGQSSPYSALTAMAIDPIFIALDDVEDWQRSGTAEALGDEARAALERGRDAPRVDYAAVRAAKHRALRHAFASFGRRHFQSGDVRDRAFAAFADRERWWLDDYAMFRALHDEHDVDWREWEPGIRDRDPAALRVVRERLERPIRYYSYLQWIADEQWQRAREEMSPVGIFGDFPFMVSGNSADVWARQHDFDLDSAVGTPPDAFSATGQDWGLPAYRWDVVSAGHDAWLRDRVRRSVELFDGFRIDHLIGFYRTFVRRPDGSSGFIPPEEPAQRAQGERLLTVFSEGGSTIIGEDLGTVPDFMRVSLAERDIPGMKVLRWEREWHTDGHPFRDTRSYPPTSVATSGTHDTDTLAEWWDTTDRQERQALVALPMMRDAGVNPDAPFSDRTRDALLRLLFAAGSNLLILPLQDVFGWRDRINVPASVGSQNWTWRLPQRVEDLVDAPDTRERAAFLRQLAREHGRL